MPEYGGESQFSPNYHNTRTLEILSLVVTILTKELLNCLYIFPSPSGTRLGTPITNDAPYVSCHEVKSTHLHGRTPRRGVQCPLTWEFRFDWMGVAPLILHSNNCSRLYFIPAAWRSFSSGKYIFFVRRYFIYFTEYVFFLIHGNHDMNHILTIQSSNILPATPMLMETVLLEHYKTILSEA